MAGQNYSYAGKWALITGASAGLGAEFARQLAARGTHLILVARREPRLRALAGELESRHGIETEVVVADLSRIDEPNRVFEVVQSLRREVRVLVNNAGFGLYGKFETLPSSKIQDMIMVNVAAVASLCRLFLPAMVAARDGVIINVSSTSAFQSVPFMANYGASKAFVLALTEALWAEHRGSGVRALALCPGPVETEFFEVMGSGEPFPLRRDTSENVVRRALRAVDRNRNYTIPGPILNYLMANASRLMPRSVVTRITARMLRPRPAKGQ